MRRVRRDQSKLRAGACQFLDLNSNREGKVRDIVSRDQINHLLQIDAVDNKRRITAVRYPRTIQRDDRVVVIDRALRADTADHAERFHNVFCSRTKMTECEVLASATIEAYRRT